MTTVGQATLELRGDTAHFEKSMRRAQNQFKQVGRNLTRIGRTLTTRVTLPLLAIGGAAAKVGADFEREMSKIEGLVGVASDQVDQWGRDILTMAPRLGAAPQALAEGLFFVTSAGFRGAEAMDVLEQSAKASAAGLGRISTIADTVTSAVNAYGEENLSASRATDVLTAAVREGKLEAESMAPVMGNLLPTASAMGISFEQVAGMMAVFSRTGADASSSAVTLNRLMLTLQKNTGPAVDMLEDAGLSLADLRDIASGPEGLIGVMRLLDKTFADNEEALANIFPNIRAFRGVMNALAQDTGTVDSILDGVADSAGSMENAFNVAADTASFKFQQALAGLQSVGIRIGAVILPRLSSAAQKLTGFLGSLSPAAIDAGVQIAAIAAAAGPTLIVLGTMVSSIGSIVGVVGKFVGALATLSGLFNPVVLGLVAVAAGLRQQLGSWGAVKDAALDTWDSILGAVGELGPGIFDAINPALNFLIGAFVSVGSVAVEAGSIAIEGWRRFFVFILQELREVAPFWIGVFQKVAEEVTKFARIMSFEIGRALGDLKDSSNEGVREIGEIGQRLADAAVAGFGQDYVGDFVSIIDEGIEAARARINAFRGAISGGTGGGGEGTEDGEGFEPDLSGAETQTDGVGENLEKMQVTAEDVSQSISSSFASAFQSVVSGTQDLASAFGDLAKSIIADLAAMIAKAFLFNAIMGFITGGASLSGQFFSGFGGSGMAAAGIPGRAHGGPVTAHNPFLVGERGPELFVPSTDGRVVPNNQMGGPDAGSLASEILSRVGSMPSPQNPEAAARDRWYRSLFAEMVEVGKQDGVRFG